jgi:hypothetical protein
MTRGPQSIGEILESLAKHNPFIRDLTEWGKAGPSEATGNLGGSRRVPKEKIARKLGRGDPRRKERS